MPNVRELIHTLRTPLATIEMNMQRLQLKLKNLSIKLDDLKESAQIEEIFVTMNKELYRIINCLDSTNNLEHTRSLEPQICSSKITNKLLFYYFPTSVACVDDDPAFLNEIQKALGKNKAPYIFSNPYDAIEKIKSIKMAKNIEKTLFKSYVDDEIDSEQPIAEFDIQSAKQILTLNDRFQFLNTMIVDYHMPEIDGLNFCESLKDLPVKKILLTGDADYERAVNAFNRNIIDGFIVKGGAEMLPKLESSINQMQNQLFFDVNNNFYNPDQLPIYDTALISLVNNWQQENNIAEYYMINKSCSYLGLTANGQVSILLIQNTIENDFFCESAISNKLPPEFCKILSSKQYLLGLLTENEAKIAVNNWKNYLYPASKIDGVLNAYYYSIINTENLNRFFSDSQVLSYTDYTLGLG